MKPRRRSGAAWLLQQAPSFKPNRDPLHQGILAGEGVWDFPDRFFPHGQDLDMNLPLQWVSAWWGKRNPMKAAWGLLSIHPAPLPSGATPGGAGPLRAPGKGSVCEWGGTQGTCRKLCGIAEDGKIPGICPFSEKTSELGGVFLSIQSARPLGNFLRRLWL